MTLGEGQTTVDISFADIFKVRIQGMACPFLRKKLDYWRSIDGQPDMTIARGPLRSGTMAIDADRFIDDDCYQVAYAGATYEIGRNRLTCNGEVNESFLEHFILMPLMNQRIVANGHYLSYAAAVSYKDKVIAFPGISGSGKTSLVLEFLSKGAKYLGNNNIFVDRNGQCILYSPYISFPERNARLYPELVPRLFSTEKERRQGERQLSFHQLGMAIKGNNLLSRAISSQLVSRCYFLGYAPFNQLYPGCQAVRSQKVDYAFLLERKKAEPRIIKSSPQRLAALQATSDWIVDVGYHSALSELVGLPYCEKDQVVDLHENFFGHAECYEVRIPLGESREGFKDLVKQIESIVG